MLNIKDKNILVIDDDHFTLKITKRILNNIGFKNITLSLTAQEGLSILTNPDYNIHVTFLDLKMPDIDGIELIRMLGEIKYSRDIILLSGEGEEILKMSQQLAKARNLSVLGALSKPLNSDKVLDMLCLSSCVTSLSPFNDANTNDISLDRLKKAIEENEFEPWFQPKVSMKTKEVIGVEALARWPVGELLSNFVSQPLSSALN